MDNSTSLYIPPRVAAKKYGVTRATLAKWAKEGRADSFDVERESPLRIDTCLQTSSAISTSSVRHQRNAQSSSTLESRQQNKERRVISRVKSNNSKNTVQTTTKLSRTLRQGSTSSVGFLRQQSSLEMSKKWWSPTETDSRDLVSTPLNVRSENTAQHSTCFRTREQTSKEPNKNLQKICSQFVTTSWPITTEDKPLPMLEKDKKGVLKTSNMSSTSTQRKITKALGNRVPMYGRRRIGIG